MDVAGELSKLTGCKVKATNDANAAALERSGWEQQQIITAR